MAEVAVGLRCEMSAGEGVVEEAGPRREMTAGAGGEAGPSRPASAVVVAEEALRRAVVPGAAVVLVALGAAGLLRAAVAVRWSPPFPARSGPPSRRRRDGPRPR